MILFYLLLDTRLNAFAELCELLLACNNVQKRYAARGTVLLFKKTLPILVFFQGYVCKPEYICSIIGAFLNNLKCFGKAVYSDQFKVIAAFFRNERTERRSFRVGLLFIVATVKVRAEKGLLARETVNKRTAYTFRHDADSISGQFNYLLDFANAADLIQLLCGYIGKFRIFLRGKKHQPVVFGGGFNRGNALVPACIKAQQCVGHYNQAAQRHNGHFFIVLNSQISYPRVLLFFCREGVSVIGFFLENYTRCLKIIQHTNSGIYANSRGNPVYLHQQPFIAPHSAKVCIAFR